MLLNVDQYNIKHQHHQQHKNAACVQNSPVKQKYKSKTGLNQKL